MPSPRGTARPRILFLISPYQDPTHLHFAFLTMHVHIIIILTTITTTNVHVFLTLRKDFVGRGGIGDEEGDH
jgi:hypothetical protein